MAKKARCVNKEEQYILYLIVGFVFLLPLFMNPFAYNPFAPPKLFLLFLFTALTVSLFTKKAVKEGSIQLPAKPISISIGLLLFLLVLSTIFSINPKVSLFGGFERLEGLFAWLSYFWCFYLGYFFLKDENKKRVVAKGMAYSISIVSVYAFFQAFGYDFLKYEEGEVASVFSLTRVFSTTGNASNFASLLVLVLPVILVYAFFLKKKDRTLFLASSVLGVIALFLTFSKGGWLSFLIGLILFAALFYGHKLIRTKGALKVILISAAVIILLSVVFVFFGGPGGGLKEIIRPSTAKGRLVLWEHTLCMIKDRPLLGFGLESFEYALPSYITPEWEQRISALGEIRHTITDRAHNLPLQIAVSTGIIAMLVSFHLFFLFVVKLFKYSSKKRDPILLGISAGLISYIASLFFHFSTIDNAPIFFLFFGLVFSELYQEESFKFSATLTAKLPIFALSALFAVLTLFSVLLSASGIYLKNGLLFLNKGQTEEAVESLSKADSLSLFYERYPLIAGRDITRVAKERNDTSLLKEAEVFLKKAAQKNPENEYVDIAFGDLYLAQYELEKDPKVLTFAQKHYERVLEHDPNFSEVRIRLGVAYAYGQNYEKAAEEWEKATYLAPESKGAFLNLARLYELRGENDKALLCYRKVLEVDSSDAVAGLAIKRLEEDF